VDEIVISLTAAKELLSKVKIDKTATWNTPTTALFMDACKGYGSREKLLPDSSLQETATRGGGRGGGRERNAEIDAAVKENVATFTLKVEICENCNEEPNPVKLRCAFPRCKKSAAQSASSPHKSTADLLGSFSFALNMRLQLPLLEQSLLYPHYSFCLYLHRRCFLPGLFLLIWCIKPLYPSDTI